MMVVDKRPLIVCVAYGRAVVDKRPLIVWHTAERLSFIYTDSNIKSYFKKRPSVDYGSENGILIIDIIY